MKNKILNAPQTHYISFHSNRIHEIHTATHVTKAFLYGAHKHTHTHTECQCGASKRYPSFCILRTLRVMYVLRRALKQIERGGGFPYVTCRPVRATDEIATTSVCSG